MICTLHILCMWLPCVCIFCALCSACMLHICILHVKVYIMAYSIPILTSFVHVTAYWWHIVHIYLQIFLQICYIFCIYVHIFAFVALFSLFCAYLSSMHIYTYLLQFEHTNAYKCRFHIISVLQVYAQATFWPFHFHSSSTSQQQLHINSSWPVNTLIHTGQVNLWPCTSLGPRSGWYRGLQLLASWLLAWPLPLSSSTPIGEPYQIGHF